MRLWAYTVGVKIDIYADGNVTPAGYRGHLIAATFEARGPFVQKVTSWLFTCPDCGDDDGGDWPVTIVRGTPYSHECQTK